MLALCVADLESQDWKALKYSSINKINKKKRFEFTKKYMNMPVEKNIVVGE